MEGRAFRQRATLRTMDRATFTQLGACAGFSLFIVFGLVPAAFYGAYAGLLLAGGIFGTPVVASLATNILVVFGFLLGLVAVGSLFTVMGAVAGALLHITCSKAV